MAAFTKGTYPSGLRAAERITLPVGSDQNQLAQTLNYLLTALTGLLAKEGGADVPMTTATLSRGTTVTLASTASVISINAVSAVVAALTAQAFGALGTVPQNMWAVIGVERVLAGTTTFTGGADNYTTGYATEALAIAALPEQTADRVLIGYLTVMSTHASGWVAGTDALEGGTGGNPATETNYYSVDGVVDAGAAAWEHVLQIANPANQVLSATVES